ncbi:hypothetical protein K1X76_04405 [bacterium]|nr:hypothetical protein [bacterium]
MRKKTDKTSSYLKKADALFAKKKYAKAMPLYEKELKKNGETLELLARLIKTHSLIDKPWTNADFAKNLDWTMKSQELSNPGLKRVHAKLEPVWKEITLLISQMMACAEETEDDLIEKIIKHKEKALYPLVESLLALKQAQKKALSFLKERKKA